MNKLTEHITPEHMLTALEMAYEMEPRAIASRNVFSAMPFHWEFEDFCKKNGINCSFDFVSQRYFLYPIATRET